MGVRRTAAEALSESKASALARPQGAVGSGERPGRPQGYDEERRRVDSLDFAVELDSLDAGSQFLQVAHE
jgi:hypothetical protein